MGESLHQKVLSGNMVRIKYRDEFACSLLQSLLQGPRLEANSLHSMHNFDDVGVAGFLFANNLGSRICGVINDDNFQPLARVVQLKARVQNPFY